MLQIPLVEGLDNTVETTISNKSYTFITKWNARFDYYSMDIIVDSVEQSSGIILVSGIDIATISSIPLERVYCVNKNDPIRDFGFTGLGDDGIVVIIEDSDLEE